MASAYVFFWLGSHAVINYILQHFMGLLSQYWNGRLLGLPGAMMQSFRALALSLADKISSIAYRANLGAAGKGVIIRRGVIIRHPSRLKLGNNVRIGRACEISCYDNVEIGDNTWMDPRCMLDGSGGISIGKNCSLSEGVSIHTHTHGYENGCTSRVNCTTSKVSIGNNVWIAEFSTILPSAKSIGNNSVIAANTIVTQPVPDNVVVAGNPGRIVEQLPSK